MPHSKSIVPLTTQAGSFTRQTLKAVRALDGAHYFDLWDYDGTLERIHHTLYVACRERVGREVSPTAAIIDSQSVKGAEKGGARSTRPATTRARRSGARSATSWSTRRACLHALVHPADIQDRDGGVLVMATLFGLYPFLLKLFADGGYQGPTFQDGLRKVCRTITVEIVRRSDQAKGFACCPSAGSSSERSVGPLPPSREGLGMQKPERASVRPLGLHPPHDPKALSENIMMPDRL